MAATGPLDFTETYPMHLTVRLVETNGKFAATIVIATTLADADGVGDVARVPGEHETRGDAIRAAMRQLASILT